MNLLFFGDNLDILRRHVGDNTVDLIYLDPPFQSGRDYNVMFREQSGDRSAAQIKAFEDTWRWDLGSQAAWEEVVEGGGSPSDAMQAFMAFLGPSDMLAYLSMMAPRLIELRRVLKADGSIYLHCDPTASHYLKMLMDSIFGPEQFQNEIVWSYRGGGVSPRRWGRKHDIILYYSKGDSWTFNADPVRVPYSDASSDRLEYKARSFRGDKVYDAYEAHPDGKHPDDVFVMQPIMPSAKERLGYPTQKPERLLERIILASSDVGDVVLDPFCGCGTTVAVAQRLERQWIGVDITHLAINLIKFRLQSTYGEEIVETYEVHGEPVTLGEAAALALEDRFEFENWALGLVGARKSDPTRGADKGIDGQLLFHDRPEAGETRQIIISVKSGKTGPRDVRDLRGVLDREGAEIGVLITLNDPTPRMIEEAASAGFYDSPWGKHPRIQILTVEHLMDGYRIDYPRTRDVDATYKRAPKYERKVAEQLQLDDGDS